jgi:hypothetical protein
VKFLGKEEADYVKIFVVRRSEPSCVGEGLRGSPHTIESFRSFDELFWGKVVHTLIREKPLPYGRGSVTLVRRSVKRSSG